MRVALLMVLAIISMHHAAMTNVPHSMAAPVVMTGASVLSPALCHPVSVAPAQTCGETCAIVQATNLERWTAASPVPAGPALHHLRVETESRLFANPRAPSGLQGAGTLKRALVSSRILQI